MSSPKLSQAAMTSAADNGIFKYEKRRLELFPARIFPISPAILEQLAKGRARLGEEALELWFEPEPFEMLQGIL